MQAGTPCAQSELGSTAAQQHSTTAAQHHSSTGRNMKTELKKNASLDEDAVQKKLTYLTSRQSNPPTPQLQDSSNPSASLAVRSSLLKSMEMICVTPHVPLLTPLQQSFLGNIYKDMVIVEEGAEEMRDNQDGQQYWTGF